jgi:hypothetical protein
LDLRHLYNIRVRVSVPRIVFFGPASPPYSLSARFGPSNHFLRASSAFILFECGRFVPRIASSGLHRLHIFEYGLLSPSNLYFGLSMLSSHLFRNMVAINRFGCRMSNTKVSPQLAILDGPVFVSSALCRESFHAYGMKKCTDGRIGCLTITGLRLDKSNAA